MIKRATFLSLGDLLRAMSDPRIEGPSLRHYGRSVCYAGYSRFAFFNILKTVGLKPGEEVLLPAYGCDVMPLVLEKLELRPVYYGITDDFQIDFDTLPSSPRAKVLVTINYFGFSIDFAKAEQFARAHDLVWINDNAHGYASCHGTRSLASFGDFSVTSFRKIVPALNGSIVAINTTPFLTCSNSLERLNGEAVGESSLRYLATTIVKNMGLRGRPIPDYSDIHAFSEGQLKPYRIHRSSLHVLSLQSEESIRARRRKVYGAIHELIKSGGYSSLSCVEGVMGDGNSPMVCPIRTRTPEHWSALLRVARKYSLDLHTWPSMPSGAITDNSFGCVDMWRRYLYLPVHQDMDLSHYCRVLDKVFKNAERLP
jgi:hypothetical protein